jgi:ATP-dependent Lon protease
LKISGTDIASKNGKLIHHHSKEHLIMSNDNPLTSVNAIEAYSIPSELPMLVTSEVVIYPLMAAPLLLEDERAVKAAQAAIDAGHKVLAIFGELEESEAEEWAGDSSIMPK